MTDLLHLLDERGVPSTAKLLDLPKSLGKSIELDPPGADHNNVFELHSKIAYCSLSYFNDQI